MICNFFLVRTIARIIRIFGAAYIFLSPLPLSSWSTGARHTPWAALARCGRWRTRSASSPPTEPPSSQALRCLLTAADMPCAHDRGDKRPDRWRCTFVTAPRCYSPPPKGSVIPLVILLRARLCPCNCERPCLLSRLSTD